MLSKVTKLLKNNQFFVILLGIFIFALYLRFYKITSVPPGFSLHELSILDKAKDLTKDWRVEGSDISSALYLYLVALIGQLTSFNETALRIMQATLSFVSVFVFYLFTREWYEKRVALFATLFLSINAFYLTISRIIEPSILTPLFLILITYLFTLAFEKDRYFLFILAAIASGLALYVDKIYFILPFIFILIYIYFYKKNREFLLKYLKKIVVTLVVFVVISIPYVLAIPETLRLIFNAYNPSSVGRSFIQLGTLISTLLYQSPIERLYYVGTLPLLSPFIGITFICGMIYAFFHIERRRYYYLLIMFFVLATIVALGSKEAPTNYLILFPLIFIFSATIFEYLLNVWFKTFPYNRTAKLSFALVLSFFIFISLFYNYQKFFTAWANNKEIRLEYSHHFIKDK